MNSGIGRSAMGGRNTYILSKGGHGSDGAERGDDAVESICKDASLDARVVHVAVDLETRNIAGGGDVANGFHGEDHVDC